MASENSSFMPFYGVQKLPFMVSRNAILINYDSRDPSLRMSGGFFLCQVKIYAIFLMNLVPFPSLLRINCLSAGDFASQSVLFLNSRGFSPFIVNSGYLRAILILVVLRTRHLPSPSVASLSCIAGSSGQILQEHWLNCGHSSYGFFIKFLPFFYGVKKLPFGWLRKTPFMASLNSFWMVERNSFVRRKVQV